MHDYILYGVDEERKEFYSAGYLSDGKYQSYKISFSDFLKSVYNTPQDKIQFGFRTYNTDYKYCFNKERVIGELNDYLNSTTSHGLKENAFYGIEANKKLKEYFLFVVRYNENSKLDLRYTRAYMEHKYFIWLCAKYLLESELVSADKINIKEAEAVYDNATKVHLLSIKLNISKNYKIIDKIVKLFEKIQDQEIRIISNIINILK